MTEGAVGTAVVAEEFDVTCETVRVHAKAGHIPGFKVGSRWRFYLSEVRAARSPSPDPWAQSSASRNARRKS